MAITEADTARPYVAKYCQGMGVDVGCGQRKIAPLAIGVDFATGYDLPAARPTLGAEIICGWETFFPLVLTDCLDYIFSSALLEDYENPTAVLEVWCRTLKPGGYLILYLPVEELYQQTVAAAKRPGLCNKAHKADWKDAEDFLSKLGSDFLAGFDVAETSGVIEESKYMFYVVLRKKA